MQTRLERKRAQRNANSKRKRHLRNRGMVSQAKLFIHPWDRRIAAQQLEIASMPLRGIHAQVEAATPKPKRGFLTRLFRRGNA